MSVCKGDRKESKVEFDNAYFKIYEDCVRLSLMDGLYNSLFPKGISIKDYLEMI